MNRKIYILHEIYGLNDFIKKQALTYSDSTTSVECIPLYQSEKVFTYNEEKEAYDYFMQEIGFDKPLQKLTTLLLEAKNHYQEVVLIGFSVGATLAWRLSTCPIDRIICIYGSRIRQYVNIQPKCPTLVILPSEEKSFDVNEFKYALEMLPTVHISQFPGQHGFMDENNLSFCQQSYMQAQSEILRFLRSRSSQEDLE